MTFEMWMEKVDRVIGAMCGMSYLDLADIDYRGMYNDEVPPQEAAEEALENEDFPF